MDMNNENGDKINDKIKKLNVKHMIAVKLRINIPSIF